MPHTLIGKSNRLMSPISAAILHPSTYAIPGALLSNGAYSCSVPSVPSSRS